MERRREDVGQAKRSRRPREEIGEVSRSKRPTQTAESRDQVCQGIRSRRPREEVGDAARSNKSSHQTMGTNEQDVSSRGLQNLSETHSPNQQPSPITVIGSTSGTPDEDVAGPLKKKPKNVRGQTLLKELTDLPSEVRLPIEWGGLNGGPCSDWSCKLANFCGIIARNREYVPIQLQMPLKDFLKAKKTEEETNGRFLFRLVYERFQIDDDDEDAERKVLKKISNSYSEYLCKVKDTYFKHKTEEEMRESPPPEMSMEDWLFLVAKWNTEEHKVISERNSRNRAKAVIVSASGSRSHDRIFHEETKKNGKKPGKFDFFHKVHTDKLGVPKDHETARIISAVLQDAARAEEEGQSFNKDESYLQLRPKDKDKKKYGGSSNVKDVARIDELTQLVELQREETSELKLHHRKEMKAMKKHVSRFMAAFQGAGIEVPNEVVGSDEETEDELDEEKHDGLDEDSRKDGSGEETCGPVDEAQDESDDETQG